MELIRLIFAVGTICDWWNPMMNTMEDRKRAATTKSHTFFLPYEAVIAAGWDGGQVQKLLTEAGIENWSHEYDNVDVYSLMVGRPVYDEWSFKVAAHQAKEAEQLLQSRGIPIAERSLAPGDGKPMQLANFNSTQSDSGNYRVDLWAWGMMVLALAVVCKAVW